MTRADTKSRQRWRVPIGALLAVLLAGHTTGAQTVEDWTRGSGVTVLGGGGTDDATTSWLAGGGFGWDVIPRLSVEATAVWLDRGPRADGFSADLSVLFSLVPPRRVEPFVKGGFGVYRADFSIAGSPIPAFYRPRVEALAGPFRSTATFTDPMLVLGAGLRFRLTNRVTMRPEADARLIYRDWRGHWLASAALRLTYSFEDRPITDRTFGADP